MRNKKEQEDRKNTKQRDSTRAYKEFLISGSSANPAAPGQRRSTDSKRRTPY